MIIDNEFIKADRAFDDDSIIEFETKTSDTDAVIVSLLLEIERLNSGDYELRIECLRRYLLKHSNEASGAELKGFCTRLISNIDEPNEPN